MKILFANPPVIRFGTDNPENDPRINSILFRFKLKFRHYPPIFNFLGKIGIGKGARFGVRAGSRWPWTMDKPHGGPPYPFIMGYSAALLKSFGFDVNIIDAVAVEEYSYRHFIESVRKENAVLSFKIQNDSMDLLHSVNLGAIISYQLKWKTKKIN